MIIYGFVLETIPSWEETLDAICRVVPPDTVKLKGNPSSRPNIIYSPTHQDPRPYQPFTYTDELRVLVVEPGSGAEDVRCRIVNVVPSWRTRYDALSYAWGDETRRETIYVDGLRVSVTRNLHSALMHLRDPHRPRTLWVDALSVNQNDLDERDEQLRIMGFIYSNARKVVIYLGDETENVKGGMALMKAAIPSFEYASRTGTSQAVSWDWSPAFNLLRRPWFQRTWIIQEAVLAHNPLLVCGHETLTWEELLSCCGSDMFRELAPRHDVEVEQALRAMDMIKHGRHERHTKLVGRRKHKKKYVPDFRLLSTLYETRGFKCEDQRDKVYAILSMVTNVGPEDEALMPNNKDSVEEVFKTVAMWDVTKNESFELLSYCSKQEGKHPSLPSWVPDFSDMDEANSMALLLKKRPLKGPNPGFKYERQPFFYEEDEKTVLVLSANVVDMISEVGNVSEGPKIVVYARQEDESDQSVRIDAAAVADRLKWLQECVQIASRADPVHIKQKQGGGTPDIWKSHALGLSTHQFNQFKAVMVPSDPIFFSSRDVRAYAQFLYRGVGIDPRWQTRWRRYNGLESIDKSFRMFAHKRRFCATRSGQLGWVPAAAREGDLVCLASGAQVPIILRRVPASHGRERYMVVGDAFIEGYMLIRNDVYKHGVERLAIV